MQFLSATGLEGRSSADLLLLPFYKRDGSAVAAAMLEGVASALYRPPIDAGDFCADLGELLLLYTAGAREPRLALLGLGDEELISAETVRTAYAAAVKKCSPNKVGAVNIALPTSTPLAAEPLIAALVEGVMLANYTFSAKGEQKNSRAVTLWQRATLIGIDQKQMPLVDRHLKICRAVHFARDLVNGNSDDITPQKLAADAADLADRFPSLSCSVMDKEALQSEKMGLLLAVNRASTSDPVLIRLSYKGDPSSNDHAVLVGKGVTFDSGGLNLKPTGSIETMRCDMGGGAAVLAVLYGVAMLQLKVNVTALVPATENGIGPNSYKPGDVYQSYAGTTVEIGNTDAEGRLILADALAYAVKNLAPTRIIDVATLTGAADVALGPEASAIFSNSEPLFSALQQASVESGEKVWRLPLYKEYYEMLKSDVADIKNCGKRSAGCITAALFLQKFVGEIPWAHIDIASTAFLAEARGYNPKLATGAAVRLLLQFLSGR